MQSLRKLFKKIKKIAKKFWSFIKRIFTKFQKWLVKNGPSVNTQKGAIVSIFFAIIVYLGYLAAITLRSGEGILFDITIGIVIAALCLALLTLGTRFVLRIVSKIPIKYGGLFIAGLITLILFSESSKNALPFIAWVYLAFALLGGSIYAFFFGGFKNTKILSKVFVLLAFLISVASIVVFIIWLGKTGTEKGLIKVDKYEYQPLALEDVPDPSIIGEYVVKTTSYGSGKDRRDIFGKDAHIITESVNAKPFVNKLSGRFNKLRLKYWGFNRTKFPINGRVWYPEGEGKFPLVLIVHGNHSMREYSDPGYAYLGEFLASRGFIVVSVDENFLNGDWTQNYKTESDGRGWVLLKHLSVWRAWEKNPENPFYGKVDMDNISLIGHSRGGEAVAIAASFNNLSHYPDDAKVKFDFNFNIKSIIAIAPVDGQYKPSDQPTPLKNINYLLLHGSHDSDVSSFSGDKQFKRIKFDDGAYKFKTSIYIYRANHGQFNTVWGNHDSGMPGALLLNTKALLKGEEQRQIAKVYMGAFLEMTLKGNQSYLPIFKDYRYAEKWLPETLYINRFEDSETNILVDFEEDIDVTTSTIDGGKLIGEELRIWREEDFGFRQGTGLRLNKAVYLGWENPEIKKDSISPDSTEMISKVDTIQEIDTCTLVKTYPSYTFKMPDPEQLEILKSQDLSMVFSVAQLDEKVPKHDSLDTAEEKENWSFNDDNNSDKAEKENENTNENQDKNKNVNKNKDEKSDKKKDKKKDDEKDKLKIPVDFTIELKDAEGHISSIPVSEIISIMPPLEVIYTRYKKLETDFGKSSEPVLQTVSIPMDLFKLKNPEFSVENLEQIKFIFNKTSKAVIILDEIGFRKGI
ncbi:MAG: hypothetical protein CVU00_05620 [Bacteroidetes bacterium HGW-Bacteroidetes-17]|nr:MAG: hypothetical protein CVU00_05620 [Bacteroidetes bacterium HGW-Bacteroidetes-17]